MWTYTEVTEWLVDQDGREYCSYGICVKDQTKKTVAYVSDVSTDREWVCALVKRCNDGQLAPQHLIDVVLDNI